MPPFTVLIANAFFGFLTLEIAGNNIASYITVLIAFVLTLVAVKVFKYIITRKIKGLIAKTKNDFANMLVDAIEKISLPFYLVIALYISLKLVSLPEPWPSYLHYLLIITVTFYSIRILQQILIFTLRNGMKGTSKGVTRLFENIIKIFLWTIALLLILQNLGYKIDTLITGLGIAGVAIAFAMQKILEDIFSAFSIYFDKPFEVGDFVVIGNDMGTVKDIGLKSTRIQSLAGPELIISNREMTSARIINYKKMEKRRVEFSFGVKYDTPLEKLEKIPKIVTEIISKIELAELERVHFRKIGDFSFVFEVAYFLKDPSYIKYMDSQQQINYDLVREFRKEGIELAYPTQTIMLEKAS